MVLHRWPKTNSAPKAHCEPGHETALVRACAIREDEMVMELLKHPGHEAPQTAGVRSFLFVCKATTSCL